MKSFESSNLGQEFDINIHPDIYIYIYICMCVCVFYLIQSLDRQGVGRDRGTR